MSHKIVEVKPMKNLLLQVDFQNGIEKTYDIHRLYPVFPQFKVFENDNELFSQVKVDVGGYGLYWNDMLDLDAEEIWESGIETGRKEIDTPAALAESLILARERAGMTQKQLSDLTGIYQADISKIERGISNPSISTLKRLADGMGLKLNIEFK